MRISDWSSDVCSSDLRDRGAPARGPVLVSPYRRLRSRAAGAWLRWRGGARGHRAGARGGGSGLSRPPACEEYRLLSGAGVRTYRRLARAGGWAALLVVAAGLDIGRDTVCTPVNNPQILC